MSNQRMLRAGLLIGVAVILGRLLGFAREITLARNFGASGTADWVVLLFSFPDLVVNLLLGGALAAVLIPEWARQDPAARRRLYHAALVLVAGSFCLLAVGLWFGRSGLFHLLAPGLDQTLAEQGSRAFILILIAIPLTALAGVTTAYSNFLGAVFVPALGTFVLNLFVVAGLLLSVGADEPLIVFGASVALGALLRWGLQLLNLRQTHAASAATDTNGVNFDAEIESELDAPIDASITTPASAKKMLVRYFQVLASASLLLLVPVIARAYASGLGNGQMALLNYAQKIVELPVGIVVTVVATLLLPRLSRLLVDQAAAAQVVASFSAAIRVTLEISLAVLLPTMFYANTICNVLFKQSALQGEDLHTMARLLSFGLLALPLQGLITVCVCVYSATRDTLTPLVVSIVALAFFLLGVRYAVSMHGLLGIVLTMVAFQLLVLLVLALGLRKKMAVSYLRIVADTAFLRGVVLSVLVFCALFLLGQMLSKNEWLQMAWAVFSGAAMLLCIVLFNPHNRALITRRGPTV